MILFAVFMMQLANFLFRDSPPDVRLRKIRVLTVVVVVWVIVSAFLACILLIFNKPIWH